MSTQSEHKKPNFSWIIIGILIFLLLWQLAGCASPQALVNRAKKRGYTEKVVEKTVHFYDTIKGKDGKDSIVQRIVHVPCPEMDFPATRQEIRQDAKTDRTALRQETKRLRDSLKQVVNLYKDSLKFATRNNRIDSRQEAKEAKQEQTAEQKKCRWWFWLLLGSGLMLTRSYFSGFFRGLN